MKLREGMRSILENCFRAGGQNYNAWVADSLGHFGQLNGSGERSLPFLAG